MVYKQKTDKEEADTHRRCWRCKHDLEARDRTEYFVSLPPKGSRAVYGCLCDYHRSQLDRWGWELL